MQLLGTLKVSNESLRGLAIQCHALDVAAYHLLYDSTHEDANGETKRAYEELLTAQLLNLAIGLRTKFYQGADVKATVRYVQHCGILFKYKGSLEETATFSFKDVCDKIIHADSVYRYVESSAERPTTNFRGRAQDKTEWELCLSVSLFAEAVLNWLVSADA